MPRHVRSRCISSLLGKEEELAAVVAVTVQCDERRIRAEEKRTTPSFLFKWVSRRDDDDDDDDDDCDGKGGGGI